MVVYVETSALLRILLEGQPGLVAPLERAERRFMSALTQLEVDRGFLRSRALGRITAQHEGELRQWVTKFYSTAEIMEIDRLTLGRAGQSFPVEPVRSLDALHLASAQALAGRFSSITVASHDNRLRVNAEALGFALLPVSSAES